jgi:dTMP kinase
VRNEFLQIAALDPERYLIVDGLQKVDEIHAQIIERVGELSMLKRNVRDADGNRLLKPIRRVMKKK